MARSIGFLVMLSLVVAACNTGDPVPGPVGAGGLLRPLGEGDGVQGDKVVVCHCPPGKPAGPGKAGCTTLSLAPSALQAHIDHGDAPGPCATGSGGAGGEGTGGAQSGAGGAGDGGLGVGSVGGAHHSPGSCFLEACPPGKTCCVINKKGTYFITKCVDTKTAHGHCGACGNKCDPSQTCVGGSCASATPVSPPVKKLCKPPCLPGLLCIDGSCIPASQKPPGAPPKLCPGGCPSGQTCCNGTCSPTHIDEQNCGSCGNVCAPGEECCNGTCANPATAYQNDDQNCGSCGNTCYNIVGDTCINGLCCAGLDVPPPQGNSCNSLFPDACPRGRICMGTRCCTVPCTAASDCPVVGLGPNCTGGPSQNGLDCCGGICHDVCYDILHCGSCAGDANCGQTPDAGCCKGQYTPLDLLAQCGYADACQEAGEECLANEHCNSGNCSGGTCGP